MQSMDTHAVPSHRMVLLRFGLALTLPVMIRIVEFFPDRQQGETKLTNTMNRVDLFLALLNLDVK